MRKNLTTKILQNLSLRCRIPAIVVGNVQYVHQGDAISNSDIF